MASFLFSLFSFLFFSFLFLFYFFSATRRRLHGLPDHRLNHEGSQGNSEDDDGNGAAEAV